MTTTTREITTDDRIATRLAELTTQRSAISDDDEPLILVQQQLADLKQQREVLDDRIAAIQMAAANLAALGTDDADQQWRQFLVSARATLSDERLQIKSPIRHKGLMERARNLEQSIDCIDRGLGVFTLGVVTLGPMRIGELMMAAGYQTSGPELRGRHGWLGSMPEVEQRLKALSKQRAAAEAALSEALLSDDERAARDAKHDEYREALKIMHIRHGADGRSLVAFTLDDDVLDVSDMTPLQRAAFEWYEAVARPVSTA